MIEFYKLFSTSCDACIIKKLRGLLSAMYRKMKGKDSARSMHEKTLSECVTSWQT